MIFELHRSNTAFPLSAQKCICAAQHHCSIEENTHINAGRRFGAATWMALAFKCHRRSRRLRVINNHIETLPICGASESIYGRASHEEYTARAVANCIRAGARGGFSFGLGTISMRLANHCTRYWLRRCFLVAQLDYSRIEQIDGVWLHVPRISIQYTQVYVHILVYMIELDVCSRNYRS